MRTKRGNEKLIMKTTAPEMGLFVLPSLLTQFDCPDALKIDLLSVIQQRSSFLYGTFVHQSTVRAGNTIILQEKRLLRQIAVGDVA